MENQIIEKNTKIKVGLLDLIVIFFYYLLVVLLFFSGVGLFNKYFIGGALLLVFFLILLWRRQIKLCRTYFYFFIFIPLLFGGIILFKGFFSGDAVNYWLPWAREIVLQQRMPNLLMNISFFVTAREPLMPLLFAALFAFVKFNEIFVAWIPLFFMAATALLLTRWAKEKGIGRRYLVFAVLLFVANPITLKYGWDLLEEPLILFFFTAFFYYLEKYQKDEQNNIYFFLMLASAVLAIVSKLTGLILLLPLLLLFIKNKSSRKKLPYLGLLFLPVIFWFLRNYLIYDNPISPFLNNFFKGRYYEFIKISVVLNRRHIPAYFSNVFFRFAFVFKSLVIVFPFIFVSIYGFWKKRKFQYIVVVLVSCLLAILFFPAETSVIRYLYLILGILLIYALAGLQHLKSRFGLSFLFFLGVWELLATKIGLSQSNFIIPLEKWFNPFFVISRFFYNYRFMAAIILSLFFYLLLSKKSGAKYLILLTWGFYLVQTSTIQISWLNIWLPILFLVLVVLIWPGLKRLKQLRFSKARKQALPHLAAGCIMVLLFLNSWGLALAFSFLHGQIVFPKTGVYGILPEAGRKIEELEGANRDFYIYVAFPTYLAWHYNFKEVGADSTTLYFVTKSRRPVNDLTTREISELFKKSKIKYIVENMQRPFWQEFFDKIRAHPELFELILSQGESSLWRVY